MTKRKKKADKTKSDEQIALDRLKDKDDKLVSSEEFRAEIMKKNLTG